MVLGRPEEGEAGPAAGGNPAAAQEACPQVQQGQAVDGPGQVPQDTGRIQAAVGASACGEGSGLRVTRGLVKRWQVESFAAVLQHLAPAPPAGQEGAAAELQCEHQPGNAPTEEREQQQQQGHDEGTPPAGRLPPGQAPRQLHVVDFGCGTGSLLLPLAAAFPHCHFTGVEMKPAAVAILLERARAAGLANVSAARCMIEEYAAPFDVALALHACGNATDAALLLAARQRAAYVVSPCCVGKLKFSLAGGSSFSAHLHAYTPSMPGDRPAAARAAAAAQAAAVAAPCAAGQLGIQEQEQPAAPHDGTQHTTAGISARDGAAGDAVAAGQAGQRPQPQDEAAAGLLCGQLQHPRSAWLRGRLPDPEANFRVLAKVADQNHSAGDTVAVEAAAAAASAAPSAAAAAAALCQRVVEMDRNAAAAEEGYATGLFKVLHWRRMAKGDLLVGVPRERAQWAHVAARLDQVGGPAGTARGV